ncbi:hypothetical protein [Flavihumibacter fluvii]|uniref:hypothetical protein n=1 Tax=Flavihumibacter fluvii TaxID=2838157 RepID=UPI001BDEBFEA|nr:hypothetical protein [Flavihumibacter fluvii]ULQ52386.1 hypothetical protein KJS93_20060 [Flavihumibacter fluvii]
MKTAWLLFFIPLFSFGQNADWRELQGKIDSAIKIHGKVEIRRNYKIDKPLVAAAWDGKEYTYFSIQIIGEATMWDVNARSKISTTFKDAPALVIQKGKDVIIHGVNFQGQYQAPALNTEQLYSTELENYGDTTCRDSRYSPFCAIAIDPFSGGLPPDKGYPSLKSWYRGPAKISGSTDIRIEDCTFNGFTVGAILSLAGEVSDDGHMTFENIRIGTCKIGIAGTGGNEKLNKVINIGSWGTTHTLLDFTLYGKQEPGNWLVDGVNIAGNVVQLVCRNSRDKQPLHMKNVFAESLGRIGVWSTLLADKLENASINFRYINQTKGFPDFALLGDGVTISQSTLRYYGQKLPIVFVGQQAHVNTTYDGNKPVFWNNSDRKKSRNPGMSTVQISSKQAIVKEEAAIGDAVVFLDENNKYVGYGLVEKLLDGNCLVGQISGSVKPGRNYYATVYKK